MTLYCVNASIQWMLCTIPFGLSISPIVCQQRSPAPELQVPEPPASLQPGGFAPYTGEGWPGGALPPGAPGVGEYLGVPGWGTGFCLNRHGSLRAEGRRREKLARLFGALQMVAGFLILGWVSRLSVTGAADTVRFLVHLCAPPQLCLHTRGCTRSVCVCVCADTSHSLNSKSKSLWVRVVLLCISSQCCCADRVISLGSELGDEQKITSGSY